MRLRLVTIERFRGISHLRFMPGPRNVILGPNNAGKSTVLEALDLLLHHGFGRPRPAPTELDYFKRDAMAGFMVEVAIGDLAASFLTEVHEHLEGFRGADGEIVPEPGGEGIEPIVRVRVVGSPELQYSHEFAKPESAGARFAPYLRIQVGWLFDGRARDPARELAFYQGSALERLFSGVDLRGALDLLRQTLREGAESVNTQEAVEPILREFGTDLRRLGVLSGNENPSFEVGAVSRRELLQTLQLALPSIDDVFIPLHRQGRGVQRLVLVSTLLRIAQAASIRPILGLEEPEEALEPLRQAQVARMLTGIAEEGGQVFVVTHSPEIARAFGIDDFLLLRERTGGEGAKSLRELSPPVRQGYERRLDGPVVRALFSRVSLLVEGPSDRAVFGVFWRVLVEAGEVPPAEPVGLDIINCEGNARLPLMASLLHEAGKHIAAWVDRDAPGILERLRAEGRCGALLMHEDQDNRRNLEQALANGASINALAAALSAVAQDRGYDWEAQRNDLVSRSEGFDQETREEMNHAASLPDLLQGLDEAEARLLVARAISTKEVAPFEMKGARQARIIAETIVAEEGVPQNFSVAFGELGRWIENGCPGGVEIEMATP